ncbi:MAG: jacalin-like lectin, partial [Candidatus Thiodiazotropha sp.]
EFDIVNVQEDFNYHAYLYDTCNQHYYRSPTTGGMGIGSGLNTMSYYPFDGDDMIRIAWDDCNGVDCLTPKGFTLARVRLAEGVYVDIYNLHTQAQVDDADLEARRANILQLLDYIEENSADNAVIVMGDTNTRYTREGDNILQLLEAGFSDVWIELIRGGDVPVKGSDALVCDPKMTDYACEIVDKVLYRNNDFITLIPSHYEVRQDDVNEDGLKLSDHPPVAVNWAYATNSEILMSDAYGGTGGIGFNDVNQVTGSAKVSAISMRAGSRIDQLALSFDDGRAFSHGGNGGSQYSLSLEEGEYLTSLGLCTGEKNGSTRVFYASFKTSLDRTLSGGAATDNCAQIEAPEGWQIKGFHGRAEDEVDNVGVIYTRITD